MGQYYTVANMDKKEVLCIEGQFIGGKLLEIAETASDSLAILNQIAGPWKGDTVFLVGDYADLKEANVPYFRALRKWTDKLHLVDSLYDHARDNFTKVDGDTESRGFRFIYNHDRKEYIDILHCPRCCDGTDWREGHIAPLPLLIAMGNGRGGGDYYSSENDKFVGSWCDSIASIEITAEPRDELEYEEFHPDFRY